MCTRGFRTIIWLSVLWTACQPSECITAVVDTAQIGFFRVDATGNGNTNELPLRIRLDSLQAAGFPLITLAEDSLTGIRLPLSPRDTVVTFLLYRRATAPDTLLIAYDNHLELISHECGFQPRYEIKALTLTGADSTRIVRATLTTADEFNVRIFL